MKNATRGARLSMTRIADQSLAIVFIEKRALAYSALRRELDARGLRLADGWTIAEETRDLKDGVELILRPSHRYLPEPADLECVVRISNGSRAIETQHLFRPGDQAAQ